MEAEVARKLAEHECEGAEQAEREKAEEWRSCRSLTDFWCVYLALWFYIVILFTHLLSRLVAHRQPLLYIQPCCDARNHKADLRP